MDKIRKMAREGDKRGRGRRLWPRGRQHLKDKINGGAERKWIKGRSEVEW